MLRARRLAIGLLVLSGSGVLVPTCANAAVISRIIAFGDSLSDSGNFHAASGGQPPAPYAQRFSNGPVWVEQLGPLLGVPAPAFSLGGGTDYAFGFARASNTGLATPISPSLGEQVSMFLGGGQTATPTDLFVIWAGANDLFDGQTNPQVPAAAIAEQVKRLSDAGARQVLVMHLPPIQKTPDLLDATAEMRAGTAAYIGGFNLLLAGNLAAVRPTLAPDLHLMEFDTTALFEEIIGDPGAFGLTSVTERAFVAGPPSSLAADPSLYLFWDGVHPTTTAHGILAAEVSKLFNVPEPGIMALALVGLCLIGRRQRRAVLIHT